MIDKKIIREKILKKRIMKHPKKEVKELYDELRKKEKPSEEDAIILVALEDPELKEWYLNEDLNK